MHSWPVAALLLLLWCCMWLPAGMVGVGPPEPLTLLLTCLLLQSGWQCWTQSVKRRGTNW